MENNDFLTVAEYAKIRGISKQAVYQQLNKGLKKFVKVDESGKKLIAAAALSPDQGARIKANSSQVEQVLNQDSSQLEQAENSPFWQKQIEEKDKQIASLQRQIESQQKHIDELTGLLNNSQVLLAAENKELLNAAAGIPVEEDQQKKKGGFLWFRKGKK